MHCVDWKVLFGFKPKFESNQHEELAIQIVLQFNLARAERNENQKQL